jgi:hypothetical protein
MADRVTWNGGEVLHVGVPKERVTWNAVEVLHVGSPTASERVTSNIIEVLRSTADGFTKIWVTNNLVEVLVPAPSSATQIARGTVCIIEG